VNFLEMESEEGKKLQLTDEVIVLWQPPMCGWIVYMDEMYVSVFIGDAIIKDVQRMHVQLKDRAKRRCQSFILEAIARVLESQSIPNQTIPRMNFDDISAPVQALMLELVHVGCNYVAFRNFYITSRFLEESASALQKKMKSQEKLAKKLKDSESKISKYKSKSDENAAKHAKDVKMIKDLEKEISDARSQNSRATEDHLRRFDRERLEQTEELEEQTEELEELRHNYSRLMNRHKELEDRLANGDFERESLMSGRDTLSREVRELRNQIAHMETDESETLLTIEDLQIENRQLRKDYESFKHDKFANLKENYDRLERQLTNVTSQLKQKSKKLDKQVEENTQFKLESEALQEVIRLNAALGKDNEEYEQKLAMSKKVIQELTDKNLKESKKIETLYNEKSEIVKRYEKSLNDKISKNRQLQMLNSDYAQKISALEKENQALQSKLVMVNEVIERCLPNLKSGSLESNLRALEVQFKEVLSHRIQYKEKHNYNATQMAEQIRKINDLHNELRRSNKTIDEQILKNQKLLREHTQTIEMFEGQLSKKNAQIEALIIERDDNVEQMNLMHYRLAKIAGLQISIGNPLDGIGKSVMKLEQTRNSAFKNLQE